jgi:hypothetical protein
MIDGRFVYGLLKQLLVMALQKFDLYLGMNIFVPVRVIL